MDPVALFHQVAGEFAHYVPEPLRMPFIRLREAGDPEYFPPGAKHRYTRRP
ncbi:hypothetical protein [Nonomuraea sp. NPDC048916]|uniref:hypothetical protein n=1 Tax=Nonomuraea sp. NPDC048916 TaxID=3154232 RepID=UPI0033F95555